MDKFLIKGGKPLTGEVRISGAKNSILAIMAASLLTEGTTELENVPHINDIKMMAHLMRIIGARVDHYNEKMTIDATHCSYFEAPYELVSKMRASIYVLGPLVSRFGEARVSFPGGCAIGNRPVDLHLKAIEKLGAEVKIDKGDIVAKTKQLKGNRVFFEKSSVGATVNTLMAAVMASGKTNIENAAMEPEIDDLINFLVKMGAKIKGRGTAHLEITGVKKLNPVSYKIMADRIEAGTFLVAGAMLGKDMELLNCNPEHIEILIEKLEETGAVIKTHSNTIRISAPSVIKPVNITTRPYPGFPTDLQAQFMALMTLSNGVCSIEDTIFPERFMHVAELRRLDANIKRDKNISIVTGVKQLTGAKVMATDLRASAALVLAGLAAKGETEISRIYHIDRGYYRIENKLKALGADIKRIIG